MVFFGLKNDPNYRTQEDRRKKEDKACNNNDYPL